MQMIIVYGPVHPFDHDQFEFTHSTTETLSDMFMKPATRYEPKGFINTTQGMSVYHSVIIKKFLVKHFGTYK